MAWRLLWHIGLLAAAWRLMRSWQRALDWRARAYVAAGALLWIWIVISGVYWHVLGKI